MKKYYQKIEFKSSDLLRFAVKKRAELVFCISRDLLEFFEKAVIMFSMNSFFRKFIIVSSIIMIASSPLFACKKKSKEKQLPKPEWLSDKDRKVSFPQEKYVSALSWGGTPDDAKFAAAAELSNYVQSSINAQISSSTSSKETTAAGKIPEYDKMRSQKNSTQISSAATLYQVQYTLPWKNVKEERYYCLAYIVRDEAWDYIKPQMESVRENFLREYSAALLQDENFEKIAGIKRAQKILPDFYEYYDFARFIDSKKAEAFSELDNKARESYMKISELKSATKIFVSVKNDSGKRIYTKLCGLYEQNGWSISSSDSGYRADAEVIYSIDEDGKTWTAYPEFNLIMSVHSKTAASYSKKIPKVALGSEKKTVARIYYEVEKELQKSFISDCLESGF